MVKYNRKGNLLFGNVLNPRPCNAPIKNASSIEFHVNEKKTVLWFLVYCTRKRKFSAYFSILFTIVYGSF